MLQSVWMRIVCSFPIGNILRRSRFVCRLRFCSAKSVCLAVRDEALAEERGMIDRHINKKGGIFYDYLCMRKYWYPSASVNFWYPASESSLMRLIVLSCPSCTISVLYSSGSSRFIPCM